MSSSLTSHNFSGNFNFSDNEGLSPICFSLTDFRESNPSLINTDRYCDSLHLSKKSLTSRCPRSFSLYGTTATVDTSLLRSFAVVVSDDAECTVGGIDDMFSFFFSWFFNRLYNCCNFSFCQDKVVYNVFFFHTLDRGGCDVPLCLQRALMDK